MSLAYSNVGRFNSGSGKGHIIDITLDASYTTGGYTLTTGAAGVIVNRIDDISLLTPVVNGKVFTYEGSKLKAYVTGTTTSGVLAEAATANVSTSDVVRVKVTEFFAAT